MPANDFAAQNGTEKIATNALTTVNGVNIAADLIEVQRIKIGHGADGDFSDVSAATPLPVTVGNFPATQAVSGTVAVSNMVAQGLTDAQLRLTAVPVSGAFFQVTQPVSLAANTPDVTDRAARALGTIANTTFGATLAAETIKVIGTVNIAAAQTLATVTTVSAVTAITNALPVGANVIGALTANQSVNNAQIGGVAVAAGSGISGAGVQRVVLATDVALPAIAEQRAATLHISVTAAVNTALTATLPAAGVGLFHYITAVELVKLYSVIGVAAGAGVIITTTNMPGAMAFTTEQAAGAVGTTPKAIILKPATPIRCSAANIATTFVAPAQLQTIWRWNVSYFTAA